MKKLFFVLLIIFGLLTAIGANPGFAIIIMFMTLGLGAIALFGAVNGLVALVCLIPVVFLGKIPALVRWGLAAVLLAAAFFGPGVMSDRKFNALVAQATTNDVAQTGAAAGKTYRGVDLVRPGRLALDPRTALQPSDNCGALCQRVLHGGQFDWVRVIVKSGSATGFERKITVARGTDADCAETLCFVYLPETDAPADIRVEIGTEYNERQGFASSVQRVTITHVAPPKRETLWQQSEVRASVVSKPTYLIPRFDDGWNGRTDIGYNLSRAKRLENRIDPEQIAKALGLKLAPMPDLSKGALSPMQKGPTPSATKRIGSLLDLQGKLWEDSETEIRVWAMSLEKAPTLSATEVDLLMRIAQDVRIDYPRHATLFTQYAALREVMLPWAFDTLERNRGFKPGMMNSLINTMSRTAFPAEALGPYADSYRALLANPQVPLSEHHSQKRYNNLLTLAGRFGFDPTPILQDAYAAAPRANKRILSGICNSQSQWHSALVPLARRIVADQITHRPGTKLDGTIKRGLIFLVSQGFKEDAIKIVQASDWNNKEFTLQRGFLSDTARPLNPSRACG